jgi:8-oxo-dGTP diphosphatase
MHVVGVGGVLTNALGQVLLVRTARAGWELPGGRVEAGEDLIGALQREVHEEAGCVATIDALVGVYAHARQDLLILIFRGTASTTSPAPVDDEDVLEAAWFTPHEALRLVTHEREHEALVDGLSSSASVIYRAYDLAT